jgi:hypothetical protein
MKKERKTVNRESPAARGASTLAASSIGILLLAGALIILSATGEKPNRAPVALGLLLPGAGIGFWKRPGCGYSLEVVST